MEELMDEQNEQLEVNKDHTYETTITPNQYHSLLAEMDRMSKQQLQTTGMPVCPDAVAGNDKDF